jgi:hypothetical protein
MEYLKLVEIQVLKTNKGFVYLKAILYAVKVVERQLTIIYPFNLGQSLEEYNGLC